MTTPPTTEYRQYRFRLPPGGADLLLVRHGESMPVREDLEFPTVDGQSDPPLDPHGQAEALHVAQRLANQDVAAIYVTPLRRTAETAAPLAERLRIPVEVEPDLREVHLGEWEGGAFRIRVSADDPLARQMFEEESWDVIPGAEPYEALCKRVSAAINRIAERHADQRVAVFTHGGVIGTIMALATGSRRFAFIGSDNASITHLVVDSARWIVRRFNDTGHLGTDLDRPVEPLT